ncbi:MAG: ATP synthase F1 subunit epsilon [Anaerolineaceae bacterium]|nr:ATP synthase F1 subunit epsilon [Anaerolineaceae bacterium]
MTIHCEIVTQERIVFQGEADLVTLPGEAGEIGILPHHSPLLTVLKYGIIKVRLAEAEKVFTVFGGVAEIQPDQITILADAAESLNEIDAHETEEAKHRAERALKKKDRLTEDVEMEMWEALRRSNVRLEAVHRFRQSRD